MTLNSLECGSCVTASLRDTMGPATQPTGKGGQSVACLPAAAKAARARRANLRDARTTLAEPPCWIGMLCDVHPLSGPRF
ncbi:MAG: hypothetical protein N2444_04545 [Methylocystis sp.]|nr:hypothetical protein [Methylocystis sp.]